MAGQFSALLAARIGGSLLLLLMNLLVARWAGPKEFGTVATIVAISTVFFVLADFGFSSHIPRAAAQGRMRDVSAALWLNTFTSSVGGVVAVIGILVLCSLSHWNYALSLVGAGLALEKNADTALGVAYAAGNRLVPAVSILSRRIVGVVVLLGLHMLDIEPIFAFGIAMLVGAACAQIYTRIALADEYRVPRSPTYGVWVESVPFLISNLTASARNLDVVILTAVSGSRAGGLYSAAQRLTSPFLLVPGVLSTLVLPHASRREPSGARGLAVRLILIHLGILLVLALISPFSSWIVETLLGSSYRGAGPILVLTFAAFPFIALSSPLGGILQSQGRENIVAVNGALFAAALLLAGWVGAQWFGSLGVATAVAIVYLAKCIALSCIILRVLK